ncbi:uncharacterized protein LOC126902099 [Daktulosphaira vitifoliae]|uniref:uncharacterized protein LOC126902099 n=1 Tax=Daktulosphaira vitifoliae TaxID=58002 RepID=UPI0021AAC02A|nr:uncharacterized protein LOC126902099 [Daktulosphaira vitifoliae]
MLFEYSFIYQYFILFIVFILICIHFFFFRNEIEIEQKKRLSQLPTVTKSFWDVLAYSLKFGSLKPPEILPFIANILKTKGQLVLVRLMLRNYILINDPEDVKVLLSSTQHITKGPDYKLIEPWLSTGLLTSTDEKWHMRRKLLTNTFHFKILESYMPALNKHSNILVKNLIKQSDDNKIVKNMDNHITLCALDVIGETIMGINLKSQEGESIKYVKSIKTVSNIIIKRIFTFWLWNDTVFNLSKNGREFYKALKVLHTFTENVINEKRHQLKIQENKIQENDGNKKVKFFMDLLIGISDENPNVMTDADIREEVDTFLFEGHDTSSIAITMALIQLGLNKNMQVILPSMKHITKGPDYNVLRPWLNEGLLTSTGIYYDKNAKKSNFSEKCTANNEKWHWRRKLLTNTFHFKILESYISTLNKHSYNLMQNLKKASKDSQCVSKINSHVTLCSLDIICETIMGVNLRSQEGKSSEYVSAIKTVSKILIKRIFRFWQWNETLFKLSKSGRDFEKSLNILHKFTENVIKEKRKLFCNAKIEMEEKHENIAQEEIKRVCFLDLLIGISLENPTLMADSDIREEVDTFLFEGHDTTSIAVTMALINLGLYQNIQNLVRQELDDIFKGSNREITINDLKKMHYLERVIKETLRLYPSVPGITRKLNSPLHLKKYTIPSNTVVAIGFWLLHRNESFFPNPEEFNPDRFLPNIERHPYAFLPFSAGPRNCIGQKFAMYQIKTMLATVLRNMKVKTLGTKNDIKLSAELVLRANDLPPIKFNTIQHYVIGKIMLELYFLNVLWLVIYAVISCFVMSVCRNIYFPTKEQKLLDKLPSMTKGFWNFIKVSFELGLTEPSGLLSFFLNAEKKYGRIFHINLMGRPYVIISDPKDLKIVLSSTQHITKGPEYNMVKPWLNEGLLISAGSKWFTRRKLLTNTFHYQTLDMYMPAINKHSQILTKKLLEVSQNEKKINIKEYIILCSLDIACQTIMGVNMRSQEGQSQNYVKATKSASKALTERIFKFWLWNDFIFKLSKSGKMFYASVDVLHRYTEDIIKKKRIALSEKKNNKTSEEDITTAKSKKISFLELLIKMSDEYPNQMTDNDIKEEVDTFLFESHDTTSINLTVVLLLLGIYQDIQKLVRDELYIIFGDSDRDATMEDINNMKYLENVIKECLRIYPSVPQITRQLNDDLQLSNYIIPRNTVLSILPYVIHRNEELYPDPEKFDPERFSDEDNKSKFLFGYLPFSAGQRNCIGQKFAMLQIKIVISTILRRLNFKTLGTRDDIKISSELLIRFDSLPEMEFSLTE